MISQDIKGLIKITEDNIFIQAKNYGVKGVFKNFISKLFGLGAVDNFNKLITAIDDLVSALNITTIGKKDTEEFVNKALHHCREQDGKCVVGVFFDAVNVSLTLILEEYINQLQANKIKLASVDSFKSLSEVKSPNQALLKAVYNNYMVAINRDNFNNFFFKIRSATVDPSFIKSKINFLDNYVISTINNKSSSNRISIGKL
jgi:hypothetical protein